MGLDFTVFHKKKGGVQLDGLPPGWLHLGTCLRSIVVGYGHSNELPCLLLGYQRMQGEKAYSFLLEVVCGLHSPLVGETEILGQFKTFVKAHRAEFSGPLAQVIDRLVQDAKAVRAKHLQNLGCTSYGSLIRKSLSNAEQVVTLVGAGSLSQDIVPWLVKRQKQVDVFTRDPSKHQEAFQAWPLVGLKPLQQMFESQGVLIVAAPVSSSWLQQHTDLSQYDLIFDLRGEGEVDPLSGSNVVSLKELFKTIEASRQLASQAKANALEDVAERALQLTAMERPRPFGWDDLWAYA